MSRSILIRFGKKPGSDAQRQQLRRRGGVVAGAVSALAAVAIAGSRTQPPPPPVTAAPLPRIASAAPAPAPAPVPAGPRVMAVPASMQFQPLKVGTVSPAQLFTIRNNAGDPLRIGNVTTNDDGFLITNGCGDTLDGHSSCSIAVVFAPSKPGEQRASVAVETSDGTFAIPLHATARRPEPPKSDPEPPPPPAPTPMPMIVPMVTDGDATVANAAAIREAQAQLRDVKQVSLTGTANPPELLTQLGQLLEKNGLAVVDGADVTIHFDGTLDRVKFGRRHRAGEATIVRNGRPVLHYVLASEEYRVGDNPAEAFSRVLRRVFRGEP